VNQTEAAISLIKKVSSNSGHRRLFLVLAAAWVIAAGWFFWVPLAKVYDDTLAISPTIHSVGDVDVGSRLANCSDGSWPVQSAEFTANCSNNVETAAKDEVFWTNTRRVAKWLAIVLAVPLFLPILALASLIIFWWIRDGYKTGKN
jgi:hypothetical protein